MKTPIQQLAQEISVHPSTVARWAKAEKMPQKLPKKIMDRIADIKRSRILKGAGSVCVLFLSLSAHADLLDQIQRVETGGSKDPAHTVGDHGKALGWLQIHPSYYADAKQADPSLPPYRTACQSLPDSGRVVEAYWKRWGAKTDREKALCHHYGATAWRRDKNSDPDGYWKKVSIH